MLFKALTLWAVLVLTHADPNSSFSCKLPSPVSTAPQMPTVFQSDSYQSTVEINILDKNYSIVTQEYLDYQNNVGAIIAYKNGDKTQVIYSYSTGEIFQINVDDNTCTVQNMSTSPFVSYLGPMFNNGNGDIHHIFGSSAVLNFANNSSYIYVGAGKVRGLPVNIWATCLTYSNTVGPIKASYYFSQPGWNTSWSQQQMPLRVEIEGLTQSSTFGSATTVTPARYFHHMYDFINYVPTVDSTSSVFEPPRRLVCTNRINSRSLPKFQSTFKYKSEIINPADKRITHYEVWYNEQAKLVREDTRSLHPDPKVGVTTTVSEIHDFSTGVRYIIDPKGGCSAFPIDSKQADAKEDMARLQYNQSIIIDIRDPSSFFQFNDNYIYVGQRLVRGITCDVFSALIPNFNAGGNNVDATFEFYFLPQDWNDLPLVGLEADDKNYPVQLVISAPSVDFVRIYNFFDFAEFFVQADAFDATQCTQPDEKIKLRITFSGDYNPATLEKWKQQIYFKLAEFMQINPIRIGSLTVEADSYNIYVSAWILGTANYAQFQQIDKPTKEHVDDKVIYGVNSPLDCADLCINNQEFQCNAYEYCIYNRFACRLLKDHVPAANNTEIVNATECVLNTRPIAGPAVKETPVATAYSNLVQAVQNKQVFLSMQDSSGNTNMYTAINVEMVTGQPMSGKDLPSLPIQFSYRLETVIPQSGRVTETFIWYDGVADIVRYDARDPYGDNPYMMSYIQDFQKGISFEINQVTGSCKITALGQGAFDVVTSKPSSDGSQVVSLKSPQSLFYLSDSYRFIGQRTIRGILCDVFEASRTDFTVPAFKMSQNSIFKYYFQSTDWDYVSPDGTDLTHSKPVMLEVEDTTTGTYFTVNFYDFDDQYHPASYFDTSPCYDIDQKLDFIIIFKGQPYHPNLDQAYNSFINSAVQLMATQTRLSPMQFQQVSLRYDDNDIYLFVTALGNVPPFALFTPVLTVGLNSSITPISADTVEDCAAACVSTNSFICNSFDWCGDSGCLLGQKHAESEGDPSATPENNPCTHYIRTENGTFPTVDVSTLYKIILDYVYDDMFKLTVTLQDNSTKTYIATDIRDDLEIPTDPSDTSGSLLRNYVVTPNSKFLDYIINITNDMVSVTDCALSCSQENTFSCQSFDYSFTTGECRLTSVHPDEFNSSQPAIINASMFTNIYSKMYTMEYTRNSAEVFTTVADKRLTYINSDEMCARACTINSDFRCESFEICDDGSCNLRKTHIIQAKSSDLTNASGCTHYSRNHLYDFVERDYKTLSSAPDSKSVEYSSALSCANLCSLGELVPSCASFTTCGTDREISWCTLTTADPTVSTNVTIVDDEHCTLYTRANNVPVINPSAHVVTVQPTRPTTTTTSTTVKTQASSAIIKNPTVLSTSTYQNTRANNYANQCSPNKDSTSDTGTRVGIAFGTLFLGLIVGGVASFLFMKFRYRGRNSEDSQMLKTWGN